MKSLAIVALCVMFAVVYGILHDLITAHICVEYFTIGHPPVFGTDNPNLLALGWGVIATWWVGLMVGAPLAMVARLGGRPKRSPASLIRPMLILLVVMGFSAAASGVVGYVLARRGSVFLTGDLAWRIPADKRVPFLADLFSHLASYIVGFAGGLVLIVLTWRSRLASAELPNPDKHSTGA